MSSDWMAWRVMVDEASVQPIHVWVQVVLAFLQPPNLKPPVRLGPAEVAEAMAWPGIMGKAEMMNFPGVFNGDDNVNTKLEITPGLEKS